MGLIEVVLGRLGILGRVSIGVLVELCYSFIDRRRILVIISANYSRRFSKASYLQKDECLSLITIRRKGNKAGDIFLGRHHAGQNRRMCREELGQKGESIVFCRQKVTPAPQSSVFTSQWNPGKYL